MNVFDNIDSGRYQNAIPYSVEKPIIDRDNLTGKQAREAEEAWRAARNAQRDLHYAEDRRLEALFKADLEEEYGLAGHPKADKLYSIAYERGHSGGYREIAECYSQMAELLAK